MYRIEMENRIRTESPEATDEQVERFLRWAYPRDEEGVDIQEDELVDLLFEKWLACEGPGRWVRDPVQRPLPKGTR